LTKGHDQENYLSRPLVTSVKRPIVSILQDSEVRFQKIE
jgi:hypothetical protein